MSSPQYRRVSSSGNDEGGTSLGVQSPRSSSPGGVVAGRSLQDRVADKLIAVGWVVAAALVAYWTNFFSVLFSDTETVNRTLIHMAFSGFGINTVLTLYLTVYLPKVKVLPADASAWNVYCPRVIPIMTLTGVLTALLLIRGTWPKWGFFAPLFLGVGAMGFLFSLHFIPWSL